MLSFHHVVLVWGVALLSIKEKLRESMGIFLSNHGHFVIGFGAVELKQLYLFLRLFRKKVLSGVCSSVKNLEPIFVSQIIYPDFMSMYH